MAFLNGIEYADGQTPLDADELAGLLPRHIATQGDLNDWEAANILEAVAWLRRQGRGDVLGEPFCRELHRRMFGRTWKWAGEFRRSDKNIGCDWTQVPMKLRDLYDDTRYWIAQQSWAIDEIAARFHHRLVSIHPFPNGNGRHSRLMADCLLGQCDVVPFSWGRAGHLVVHDETRRRYIDALRCADRRDIAPLLVFVRS